MGSSKMASPLHATEKQQQKKKTQKTNPNNQIKSTGNQSYASVCSKTQKLLYINDLTYCEIQLTPTHDVIKECAFY